MLKFTTKGVPIAIIKSKIIAVHNTDGTWIELPGFSVNVDQEYEYVLKCIEEGQCLTSS